MKRFITSLLISLILGAQVIFAQGLGPRGIGGPSITPGMPPILATDCSTYITQGLLCYNTTDKKLYVGNGTASVESVQGINMSLISLHTFTDANWNDDDATWTMSGTGPLVHVTGNTTTVTATTSEAIAAGTTYKVTISGTGGGNTASYTLGGVAGTAIAASGTIAITDWITASTSGSLIITPTSTCTVSVTNVDIQKYGTLTVSGLTTDDLITKGPWVDPRVYGADCTGASDASSVFTTIVASFASQGSIYIGKDCVYKLNTAVAIGSKTVSVFGG